MSDSPSSDLLEKVVLEKTPEAIIEEWNAKRELAKQQNAEYEVARATLEGNIRELMPHNAPKFIQGILRDVERATGTSLMRGVIVFTIASTVTGVEIAAAYLFFDWLGISHLFLLMSSLLAIMVWIGIFGAKKTSEIFGIAIACILLAPKYMLIYLLFPAAHLWMELRDEECQELLRQQKLLKRPYWLPEKPSDAVTVEYLTNLLAVERKHLGVDSSLRQTEQELKEQLEQILKQREQIQVRANHARDDEQRIERLVEAERRLDRREQNIREAQMKHQRLIASTQAFFEECRMRVTKLGHEIEDERLFQQINAGAQRDEEVIANSRTAVAEVLAGLNADLQTFMVSIAQSSAPPTYTSDALLLEDWMTKTENAAERIARIRRD